MSVLGDLYIAIPMVAMGKPRMTRRDVWKKRPVVLKYHAWCDELRLRLIYWPKDPVDVSWTVYFPFPKSYSKRVCEELRGTPHRLRPDRDNIDKAILDALFDKDERIATGTLQKYWDDGEGPRIILQISTGGRKT